MSRKPESPAKAAWWLAYERKRRPPRALSEHELERLIRLERSMAEELRLNWMLGVSP